MGLRRMWTPAGNWPSRTEFGNPPGVRTSTRSSKTSNRDRTGDRVVTVRDRVDQSLAQAGNGKLEHDLRLQPPDAMPAHQVEIEEPEGIGEQVEQAPFDALLIDGWCRDVCTGDAQRRDVRVRKEPLRGAGQQQHTGHGEAVFSIGGVDQSPVAQ